MPYETPRQSRFIHAKAAEGVPWARKFVADSHGTHVKHRDDLKRALSVRRKGQGPTRALGKHGGGGRKKGLPKGAYKTGSGSNVAIHYPYD